MGLYFCRCLLYLFLVSLLSSCVSAERYNLKRAQTISVKKLQKDIDYVQRNLYKRHPDFDLYTPKSILDFKFDSLRNAVNQPLTSNEFYPKIASVIATVHQGHMATLPAPRKVSRERKKWLKKMGTSPISQFDYAWENNQLFILKNKSKDSAIKIGTEVIAVNGLSVAQLYDKYKATFTSDGYNQTALPYFFSKRIATFYTEELGVLDSAIFSFKTSDATFDRLVTRPKKEGVHESKNSVENIKDSIKATSLAAMGDSFMLIQAPHAVAGLNKKDKTPYFRFGKDDEKNNFSKELCFYGKDSLAALLTIKEFSNGAFRKPYKFAFNYIKQAGSKVLIIDLRGNPGGRASEVVELYKYLSDTSFIMYKPSKVASKTSLLRAGMYRKVPKPLWPMLSLYYPFYAANRFFKTNKHQDGSYYYKGMGGHRMKPAHELAFKGKIYLLINPESFSAACLLASRMRELPNVTIVGEETGGDFNGTVAGILPIMRLPNSKIIWRMGLMHIQPYNNVPQKGRGIMPDIFISTTVEDRISKKDEALDWIFSEEHIDL